MNAEHLRNTAAHMRRVAEATTGNSWDIDSVNRIVSPDYRPMPKIYNSPFPVGMVYEENDGNLIAHADPTFILAVADWLEWHADGVESSGLNPFPALAVADAWNRVQK